jgi:hypothetical protein
MVPTQGWFCFGTHRTDRFRHALENAYRAPGIDSSGNRVAGKGSSQMLLANEDPGLPAGRAEHFPVQGELCLPATPPVRISSGRLLQPTAGELRGLPYFR